MGVSIHGPSTDPNFHSPFNPFPIILNDIRPPYIKIIQVAKSCLCSMGEGGYVLIELDWDAYDIRLNSMES